MCSLLYRMSRSNTDNDVVSSPSRKQTKVELVYIYHKSFLSLTDYNISMEITNSCLQGYKLIMRYCAKG
ncbi:hypothetical protein HanRHA438_Chr16g0780991 [Helianthus annuus]|nr:hypothetical protein HanRHA438_Chr16g0780991 [Helianthus annuus]